MCRIQFYGVKASDPWIGGATLVVLMLVSGAAGPMPAHGACRSAPILALRYE